MNMAKKSLVSLPESTTLEKELQGIIIGPRITEKAAYAAEKNAYVFDVAMRANKIQVARAIKTLYKVDPVKVTVSVQKPVATFVRGTRGMSKAAKKATVFLPKGQKIEIA
jgi:large subunit ribosomal protein L23